ncbi:MAG: hypothetical protein ACRC33_27005 [Gemmataceae bacterium]
MTIRLILLATALTAAATSGQFLADPDKNKPPEPPELVVRFDVKATPAPRPALRYQLLPTIDEIETGTAMQMYLKCFMEQTHFYGDKETLMERERLQQIPLKELPLEKVRGYGGRSLRYADQAARLSHIDFQILSDFRREGAYTLLPEIQKLRAVAAALKVRLRGEIAERRFDDAVGTIKTLFKLGHQLGDHPTLIGNLVGLAIVALTYSCVEEMIQQPGCPNLYWALAALPSPMVSLRHGMQGERMEMLGEAGRLARDGAASAERIEAVIAGYEKLIDAQTLGGKTDSTIRAALNGRASRPDDVKAARAALEEYGLKADAVKAMPALQVILLDEQRRYEEQRDDVVKWMTQPYWRAEARMLAAHKLRGGALSWLVPTAQQVCRAQARIEQRLKMLQVLEALRLHAAANGGAVPKSLDEVDAVLPVDPYTGKPFRYAVGGGKAVLRGTPPAGQEKVGVYNVVYELRIVK